MICTAQNSQFIDKILQMKPNKIIQLLDSEDQKYILRKKQQVIRNTPEILKPNQIGQSQNIRFTKTFYNSNFSSQKKVIEQKNAHFPSKFQSQSRNVLFSSNQGQKFYSNFQNFLPKVNNSPFTFESGIKGQFSVWKGQKLPDNILQDALLQSQVKTMKIQQHEQKLEREIQFENDKEISFKKQQKQIQKQGESQKFDGKNMVQQVQQILNEQENNTTKIQNPFAPPMFQQLKNSPFISNKTNFLDIHANKKTNVGNYMSPEVYSMNMLQYAHNKKRQNTFDDRYSYPNVIMGGSGDGWMKTAQEMRQNPFQTTFISGSKGFQNKNQINYQSSFNEIKQSVKIQADNRFRQNVKDTLKYTLGDRRFTATIPQRNDDGKIIENNQTSGLQSLKKKEIPQNRTKILQNPFVRRPASTYKY